MSTKTIIDNYGNKVVINLAENVKLVPATDGYNLERADGTVDEIRQTLIDGTTANPKMQLTLKQAGETTATVLSTIPLNQNDVSLEGSLSDFDLTDDIVDFVDSEGVSQGTLNFSKYNVTVTTNTDGDIILSQDGSVLSTVSQNADGINFDASTSDLVATNVQDAIEEINDKIINGGGEIQDDFVATAGQTEFTLSSVPVGQVNISRNGALLSKASVTVSGSTATYVPAQNGANAMEAADRVSFTYEG